MLQNDMTVVIVHYIFHYELEFISTVEYTNDNWYQISLTVVFCKSVSNTATWLESLFSLNNVKDILISSQN